MGSLAYVREAPEPEEAPPMLSSGALAWARANLFSSIGSTFVTIGCVALVAYLLPQLVAWATTRAIWSASDGAALPPASGRRLLGVRHREVGLPSLRVLSGRRTLAGRYCGGGRRRFDRLAAVDQRAAAGLGGASVLCRLSDPGPHSSARLIPARSADRRYAAVGRHFRFAADGCRRDRLLLAARRASCAWTPFAVAGRQNGERRIHRVRARRAVHYDLVHGQQSAAIVPTRSMDAGSPAASIGGHRHILRRLYGGRSARRPSVVGNGDNTKPRWRLD